VWRKRQRHVPKIPVGVDPRSVPAGIDAAFREALRDLKKAWAGKPEEEVRAAVVARLNEILQPLSEPEADLLTLQIADPNWATKDPARLENILQRLNDAATRSGDLFEE
jgi:hypothetical protein